MTPALTAEPFSKTIDLGHGFYVVETITQYPLTRAGNVVQGRKTGNLYQGSTLVGTATLAASFEILGGTEKRLDLSLSCSPDGSLS